MKQESTLPLIETVTTDQLARILMTDVRGATPISFSALTEVDIRKKAWVDFRENQPTRGWSKCPVELGDAAELRINPYPAVWKLAKVQAFTGADYERSVNRQQVREGAEGLFEAKEHRWGERIGPALLRHRQKGSLYLVAHVQKTSEPIYLIKSALTGSLIPISQAAIAAFLPPDRREAIAEAQGVEKPILYTNYSLDSLSFVALAGRRLRVRHPKAST